MKCWSIKNCSIFLSVLIFLGCPPASLKNEKEITRKPDIILQIANLYLGEFNKRIEQKHILELVRVLKREQVEMLAVQGIRRYPGVSTRVDFVDELSAKTDWRNAFGEMMNISGRQTGNAVFSFYPILSHHNQTFDQVNPADYEAALQTTIDAGVRSLAVISVQMPPKATMEEQTQCMKLMMAHNLGSSNQPTIVMGNLPSMESFRTSYSMIEVPQSEYAKGKTPNIWYSSNASLQYYTTRIVETELGKLIIVHMGLFRE
jgi:endonuclease/exonuclease/phosphatase family metal-dependent hydrolase